MKKILLFIVFAFIWGCQKEDVSKKIDLNGVYVGKTTGKLDPWYFSGTARWLVTHSGNGIWADVTYYNVSANGPGVQPTSDYKIGLMKFSGTMTSDTTFKGSFQIPNVSNQPPLLGSGKISKDGKSIKYATLVTEEIDKYVRFSYDLTKE